MRFKRWSPHLLIIIALPFLLFWRWVFLGEVLYWGTILFQFWPWHTLVKTSLLAGQWPLWQPLLGHGSPLLANLQSAVFYPPNLLYLLLPVEHGLTLSVILHLVLSGLFMFLYGRRIGLSPFAATLSALTYMLSGYVVGRIQFVTMVNAFAWIPVALWLCENLVETSPGTASRKFILGLGLVLALQLLAGHAQLWFYTLWLIGGYTLFRSWQRGHSEKAAAKQTTTAENKPLAGVLDAYSCRSVRARGLATLHAMWRLGLAVGLTLLLAAAQLLPTTELMLHSPRQSGAEPVFALSYSFWPWRMITLLAPNFFGHPAAANYWGYANFWEDHAYLGVLPFLLGLTAIWGYLRNRSGLSAWRVVPFFAAMIPISLILAMGWNTPIYLWVFDMVPGFGYFQAPARLLLWYTVAMAVLAGVGGHYFELTFENRPRWRRGLIASIGVAVAGLAGSIVLSGRSQTFLLATLTLSAWLSLSVALLLAQPGPGQSPARLRWQWTVIGLVALNLVLAASPLIPTLPAKLFRQPIASANFLRSQAGDYRFFVPEEVAYATKFNQFFRFDTFGPVQVGHWQQFRETLVPNVGVYVDLPSANNDDPLVVGRWQQLFDQLDQVGPTQQERLLQLMHVGYVVEPADQVVSPPIYQKEGVAIRRVPDPLPEAYFVPHAYLVEDKAAALARLSEPDFDSRQEVIIINGEAGSDPFPTEILKQADVTKTGLPEDTGLLQPASVSRPRPEQVVLTVEAPQAGFVVLTDTFYPGWEATLDGQPVTIWPANVAFRAVAIEEAGSHTLIFRYNPRTFSVGLWISGLTLLFVIAAGALLVRDRAPRQLLTLIAKQIFQKMSSFSISPTKPKNPILNHPKRKRN